jgi:Tfp pilus assembly protein PilO
MKMSKSTTGNMIAILLSIAVIVLAWKLVLPNYFSHKNNLVALESEVSAAKAKLESLDKARADIAAVKSTADQIMVSVPKGKDEPDLISELEAIGVKNGIVIPTIDIADENSQTSGTTTNTGVIAQSAAAPATVSQSAENAVTGTGTSGETAAAETTQGAPFIVSFTVTGSFENLNGFITGLEKSVRFMNIQSFTYEVLKEGEGNSLAVQIEVYQQ